MALSSKDFWRLLVESRLRTKAECQGLYQRYAASGRQGTNAEAGATAAGADAAGAAGAQRSDVVELARWLVGQRAISRYQAKVLLAGRAGPFFFGNYVVRDRVSEGRLRGCFRAVHTPTRHSVLLWFFGSSVANDAGQYALAVEHLEAARQAVDACLSRTYEVVDLGRYKFVVVEDLLASSTGIGVSGGGAPTGVGSYSVSGDVRMRPVDACRVMRHVALGAAALHALGLAHGDIRPENVWTDPQGNGRLLQTPLSREPQLAAGFWKAHLQPGNDANRVGRGPVEQATREGKRDGFYLPPRVDCESSSTSNECGDAEAGAAPEHYADYAAPELAYVGRSVDVLTDIYAIGCTLYALLSGRPPFAGGSVAEKMQRHATEAIEPLEPLGVPRELAKVVAFAMAKDRKLRYQSAADLAEALAYFLPDEQKNVLPQPVTDAERRTAFEATQSAVVGGAKGVQGFPFMPGAGGEDTPAQLAYVATMQELVSPTIVVRERRVQSRNKGVFVLGLILALGIGGGVGYFMSSGADRLTDQADDAGVSGDGDDTSGAAEGGQVGASRRTAANDQRIAPADGEDAAPLWVSPTSGKPISWAYLPPQAEIVLGVRPRQLLNHPEGERLAAAMGPRGAQIQAAAEATIGMPLREVEQLTVAWTKNDGKWHAVFVVHPTESSVEGLQNRLRRFEKATHGDASYFVSGERSYFAPADDGKLFVVADSAQIRELIDAGEKSAPLWREMAQLVRASDADRMCTLLFAKNALIVEGEASFAEHDLAELHDAIARLFPEEYRGASISLHLDEDFYVESQLVPNPQTSNAPELVRVFRDRIERLPLDVEEYVSRIGLDPYGGRVLIRLGSMARFVEQQLRLGAESDRVVLNAYLPAIAAHNLALGTELALVQQHPAAAARPAEPSDSPAVGGNSLSVTERLRRPITVVQTGDTLERALETISAEIGIPIKISGGDFVSEGITRNNRFDLDIHDTAAEEAILAVLLKASPQGKLVYVVRAETGGEESLMITTRAAASKRGEALPSVFSGP